MSDNIEQLKDKVKSIIEGEILENTKVEVRNDGVYELSAGDKSYFFHPRFFVETNISNVESFIDGAIKNISLKEVNKYTFSVLAGKCVYWTDCGYRIKVIFEPIFNRVFNETFETCMEEGKAITIFISENYEFHLVSTFTMGKDLHEIEIELRKNFERGEYTQGEIYRLA